MGMEKGRKKEQRNERTKKKYRRKELKRNGDNEGMNKGKSNEQIMNEQNQKTRTNVFKLMNGKSFLVIK